MGKGFYFKARRLGVEGVRSDWRNIDLFIAHVKVCKEGCEKVTMLTRTGGRGDAGRSTIGPKLLMCPAATKLWTKIQEEQRRTRLAGEAKFIDQESAQPTPSRPVAKVIPLDLSQPNPGASLQDKVRGGAKGQSFRVTTKVPKNLKTDKVSKYEIQHPGPVARPRPVYDKQYSVPDAIFTGPTPAAARAEAMTEFKYREGRFTFRTRLIQVRTGRWPSETVLEDTKGKW